MGALVNLSVIPRQAAGLSPEPMTAGGAGSGAAFSLTTMFMDSGLDASRRPGMTV
jgi:hypothetical protein